MNTTNTTRYIDTHLEFNYIAPNAAKRIGYCLYESDSSMPTKPRPNHKRYIKTLRKMSPERRLLKAFELSAFTKQLFVKGLRKRFPNASQEEFQHLLRQRLDKCHNRNY